MAAQPELSWCSCFVSCQSSKHHARPWQDKERKLCCPPFSSHSLSTGFEFSMINKFSQVFVATWANEEASLQYRLIPSIMLIASRTHWHIDMFIRVSLRLQGQWTIKLYTQSPKSQRSISSRMVCAEAVALKISSLTVWKEWTGANEHNTTPTHSKPWRHRKCCWVGTVAGSVQHVIQCTLLVLLLGWISTHGIKIHNLLCSSRCCNSAVKGRERNSWVLFSSAIRTNPGHEVLRQ